MDNIFDPTFDGTEDWNDKEILPWAKENYSNNLISVYELILKVKDILKDEKNKIFKVKDEIIFAKINSGNVCLEFLTSKTIKDIIFDNVNNYLFIYMKKFDQPSIYHVSNNRNIIRIGEE